MIEQERIAWINSNRLTPENLFFVKTLSENKRLEFKESIYNGYDAIIFTTGLSSYIMAINTDECCLKLLAKNTVNCKNKDQYRNIREFTGIDSLFDCIMFISELSGSKRKGNFAWDGKKFTKI